MKYNKEIVLSLAPYKTVRLAITEANSFEEADKELMREINLFPEIKKLNKEEIEKVLRQ